MIRTRVVGILIATGWALVLAACGGGKTSTPPTSISPSATSVPTAASTALSTSPVETTPATGNEPFHGSKSLVEATAQAPSPPTLVRVTTGQHGGYDRITFEFAGDAIPGYRAEYFPPPIQCASGQTVQLGGSAFLKVQFVANAHDNQGASTVSQTELMPGLPSIVAAKQTCDFEADVTWFLGLRAPVSFRVLVFQNPPRVAVDVAHP